MDNQAKKLAPVALFVYNRLDNTRQVVEALRKNRLAKQTEVFVFSDGPKTDRDARSVDDVRRYLKSVDGFKSVTVIERPENFYIERNITEGVTEIINKYGRIIVLEDDGVSAEGFLDFMNDALAFYENEQRVMHVSAFTFIRMPEGHDRTFLWRYSENTGGGWATWKNRWDKFVWFQSEQEGLTDLDEEQRGRIELDGAFKCLNSLKLDPIPWDICWYIAIAKNNGLAVNPPRSLLRNNGLFNGTHFTALNRLLGAHPFEVELGTADGIVFENRIEENQLAISLLKKFYAGIGTRKRDRILGFFVRIAVALRITRLLKRILR